jgi:hypothetical protein
MTYHVMTSGRGVGFGALAGGSLGVGSIYSKENLDPPTMQDELQNMNTDYYGDSYSTETGEEEEENKNTKLIIGASIVGGVVVIAGVAALATRK